MLAPFNYFWMCKSNVYWVHTRTPWVLRNSGKLFSFPHSFLAVSSLTSCCFFRQGRWPSPFSSLTVAITAFFRLTPRGKYTGKTNSKFCSTPLRTVPPSTFLATGWRLNQSHRAVRGCLALLEVGDGGRGVGAHTLAEEGWVLVSAEITGNVDARTRGPAVPVSDAGSGPALLALFPPP